MRAWARDNGYEISDRGRLPAEITDAYVAAHPSGKTAKKAPAKKSTAAKAPAKRGAAKKVVAPAETATEAAETPTATEQPPGSAPVTDPSKQQSGAPEDRRLIALADQIAALADRVSALEKAQGSSNGKSGRFGRRKSR